MFNLFRSRERTVRIMLGVLLGLVSLSMLVYLIPGGTGATRSYNQNVVAVVGDEKITATDIQRTVQRLTRNQTNLPKGLLAMYLPSIVNQLVEAKAMAYKAHEVGLRVSDQELGDAIQAEIASELGGKFDMSIYQSVLAQQGMTVADYEKQRREAMLGMRLETLELGSLVVSDQDAREEYQRKNLKVGLQYLDFDPKQFESKVTHDPAQLKAYFYKNRGLFRIPEKRNFYLIVGTTADFVQTAQVPDSQLRTEYQDNLDSYRLPDRVRVRHILIKTQGKPKEEEQKLKAKAEDILKQIQHGGDFAELAKKNSEDPGSGAKGGELGWIVRGQTVPAFEQTAFSLKPGELSGLVQTEFGYHIIQVEEKQTGHLQTFDEVKPQLLADAQKEAGAANLRKAISDARAEVARNPGQAQQIANKYHLKFFKLDNFSNTDVMPEVSPQPEVMNAVFSTPKGGVTEVVSLDAQGKAAFAAVTNVIPARNGEYAEVEKDALKHYTDSEATRMAHEAAKTATDRARKGESLDAIAKQYGIAVKTAPPFTIDGAAEGIGAAGLLSAAFKSNVGDVIGPITAQSGEFVCRVSEKIPANMNEFAKNKDSIVQSLTTQKQTLQQPLFRNSVVTDLTKRGKIKINQDTIAKIAASYES